MLVDLNDHHLMDIGITRAELLEQSLNHRAHIADGQQTRGRQLTGFARPR
jgi:hypothetical protein